MAITSPVQTTSKQGLTSEKQLLLVRLNQLNRLQRDLLFMEALSNAGSLDIANLPAFASVLKDVINHDNKQLHQTIGPNRNQRKSDPSPKTEFCKENPAMGSISTNPGTFKISNRPEQVGYVVEENLSSSPGKYDVSDIGSVSRFFESGEDYTRGVSAIGYDPNGGTSYGIYQLSSRQGSLSEFIDFLEIHKPQWAARLKAAGPANTGSTEGRFPTEWKAIAFEDSEGFGDLQHQFIREKFFEPACENILSETGIDIRAEHPALQEMVWSMAVQHGVKGATNIFIKAMNFLSRSSEIEHISSLDKEDIVEKIYELRTNNFPSSPPYIRRAVARRLAEEKNIILATLKGQNLKLNKWG